MHHLHQSDQQMTLCNDHPATRNGTDGSDRLDEQLVFAIEQPGLTLIQMIALEPGGKRVVLILVNNWLLGCRITHGQQFDECNGTMQPISC